jgi:hypothetical protein
MAFHIARAASGLVMLLCLNQQVHALENCMWDADSIACDARNNQSRLGKYFCFSKYMVGIQYPTKDGETDPTQPPFTGKISAPNEKFFLEIIRNPDFATCQAEVNRKMSYCQNVLPFRLKTESEVVLHTGKSDNTFTFSSLDGFFTLYGTMNFVSFTTSTNSYASQGQCEKIN